MASRKVGVITQARMTSTRLPGKVLLEIGGKTVLQHHVDRLAAAGLEVYIATTSNASDEPIVSFADANSLPCYRGDEHNVLRRFYACASKYKLDTVVRVTSDCPLIDGGVIASALELYDSMGDEKMYLSNALERTFPRGMDFEVFSFALLRDAFENATAPADLEHVTPYINQNRGGGVEVRHFRRTADASHFRITLDTPEDLELLQRLIEEHGAQLMNAEQLIELLVAHPELREINAHIEQKKLGE